MIYFFAFWTLLNIHYMAKTVETFKTFLFYMQQKLRHTGLEPNEGDLKDGRFW